MHNHFILSYSVSNITQKIAFVAFSALRGGLAEMLFYVAIFHFYC